MAGALWVLTWGRMATPAAVGRRWQAADVRLHHVEVDEQRRRLDALDGLTDQAVESLPRGGAHALDSFPSRLRGSGHEPAGRDVDGLPGDGCVPRPRLGAAAMARCQLFCTLRGKYEVTASDGMTRRFSTGSLLLLEDTTGRGHSTRITCKEDAPVVAMALAD